MFSAFCWPTFCGVVKAAFYVCLWTFRWKRIFWNKIEVLLTVFELEWKMICLLPKNFDRCVWIRIYLSLGTFWAKKNSFWKMFTYREKFARWAKKVQLFVKKYSRRGCQNCFCDSMGTFRRKTVFWKKNCIFLIFFGHWVKKFPLSAGRWS